jgi:hypothetical protein
VAREPHAVLGISRGATRGEIEAAYRRMSAVYDPGLYGGTGTGAQEEARRRMNELAQARALMLKRLKWYKPTIRVTMSRRDLVVALVAIAAVTTFCIAMLSRGN